MNTDKQILLGCDDTDNLFAVMNCLDEPACLRGQVITATTGSAIVQIAEFCSPGIIILCFRDAQQVAAILNGNVPAPLLFIHTGQTGYPLHGPGVQAIFSCSFEQAMQQHYLASMVNSILLLGNSTRQRVPMPNRVAETPMPAAQNMSRMVLELDQKIDVLKKVKDRIAKLYPKVNDPVRAELNGIIQAIKNCVHDNKLWNDFKLYFEQVSPGFLTRIARKYPSLTEMDLKYCCYLKMNMTNDDIRALMGINQESVRTHKYRLKKKLALSREESLRAYLQAVG